MAQHVKTTVVKMGRIQSSHFHSDKILPVNSDKLNSHLPYSFALQKKKMHSYSWNTSLTTTVCQIWVNNSPISHWDWTILLARHDTFPSETFFTSQLCNKIFLLSVRWIHLFPPNLNFWFDYIPQSKHFTILTLHILSIRKW